MPVAPLPGSGRRYGGRAVLAALACLPASALADIPRAGPADAQAELWAASCAACHGTGGVGVGGFPTLAGRDAGELLALLLKQRAGTADSTIMHQYARGFSEPELARIAALFAVRPKP
jgi:cytochrome c553